MGSATTYAFGMDNGSRTARTLIAVTSSISESALSLPKFIQRPIAKLNQERTGVDMVEKRCPTLIVVQTVWFLQSINC